MQVTELTLPQLKQLVINGQRRLEQGLLPEVRQLSTEPVGPLPSFPNNTASACLESLENLAAIHKKYTQYLEDNHVMFGEEQWKRLESAMEELGLDYPEAQA